MRANLGRYELLAPIAAGGMASVWAARMTGAAGFEKIVAIKTMLPELAGEPEYRTMFLDEARIASKLRHPNVCETFDLGEEDDSLFIAMEWVDGTSLHRLMRGAGKAARPIAPALGARIVAAACAGLHAAHEATDDAGAPLAIVHRDVSPQNILVSVGGHVKITDFGVAKALGKSHATQAGQAKGKLAYMAPEQLRSMPVDRRADVFALGCVLYEITTGKKPFDAESDALLIRSILACAPPRPSAVVAGYPLELERIVARAMAREPDDRFASAEGLRIALERWLGAIGAKVCEREVAVLVHERCGEEIERRRVQIRAGIVEVPSDDLVQKVNPFAATRLDGRQDRGPAATIGLGALLIALAFGSLLWRRPIEPEVFASSADVAGPDLPAAISPAPASRQEEPPPIEPARITFVVEPPDAQLILDGEPLDPGTVTVERPAAGGQMRIVLVKAPGHVDRLFVVDADTPSRIEASLAPDPT